MEKNSVECEGYSKPKLDWFDKVHYIFTLSIIIVFPLLATVVEIIKVEYDIALFFFTAAVFYFLYRYRDRINFSYKELFYHLQRWVLFFAWIVILMAKPFYYKIIIKENDIIFSDLRFALASVLATFLLIVCIRFPDYIRLHSKGIQVRGKITKINAISFSPATYTSLEIHFNFYDSTNQIHAVKERFIYVPRLEKWNVGDEVDIIYNPKNPMQWAWVNQ